jgi:ketosteroid isomerase-like protein
MTASPELAIRIGRATFNRAIVDADLNAIAPVLAADVVLVAGTDSAVIAGRKAQLATWKREFASRDRAVYVRTPHEIIVSPIHPIAFEHGEWRGLAAVGGVQVGSGPYTAKWRQIGEDWVIEAELYLTTA